MSTTAGEPPGVDPRFKIVKIDKRVDHEGKTRDEMTGSITYTRGRWSVVDYYDVLPAPVINREPPSRNSFITRKFRQTMSGGSIGAESLESVSPQPPTSDYHSNTTGTTNSLIAPGSSGPDSLNSHQSSNDNVTSNCTSNGSNQGLPPLQVPPKNQLAPPGGPPAAAPNDPSKQPLTIVTDSQYQQQQQQNCRQNGINKEHPATPPPLVHHPHHANHHPHHQQNGPISSVPPALPLSDPPTAAPTSGTPQQLTQPHDDYLIGMVSDDQQSTTMSSTNMSDGEAELRESLPSVPGTPDKTPNNGTQSPSSSMSSPGRVLLQVASGTETPTGQDPNQAASEAPSACSTATESGGEASTKEGENGNGNAGGTTSSVAIDNKIEQAMDLVKSHLMFAVREEVDVLKEKIVELLDRIQLLERENELLRSHVPHEILSTLTLPAVMTTTASAPASTVNAAVIDDATATATVPVTAVGTAVTATVTATAIADADAIGVAADVAATTLDATKQVLNQALSLDLT